MIRLFASAVIEDNPVMNEEQLLMDNVKNIFLDIITATPMALMLFIVWMAAVLCIFSAQIIIWIDKIICAIDEKKIRKDEKKKMKKTRKFKEGNFMFLDELDAIFSENKLSFKSALKEALLEAQEQSKKNGTSDMTLDEINTIINENE